MPVIVNSCVIKVMFTTYQNNGTKLHVVTESRNPLAVSQDHDVCLAVFVPGCNTRRTPLNLKFIKMHTIKLVLL